MHRRRRRLPLLEWALLVTLGALRASADTAPEAADVTVMEARLWSTRPPASDPWIYFSLPGFEVISHCPDSFNQTYARALQMATAARLAVLPASFWGDLPTPMKIVLYNRKPEARAGFRGQPHRSEPGYRGAADRS